jgi:hypothetical protein
VRDLSRDVGLVAGEEGVGRAGDDRADDGGDPEQPQLGGAPSPLKKATAVERAGLTDVLLMGVEMRWISVRARPMAMGANPVGARPSVAPMMT